MGLSGRYRSALGSILAAGVLAACVATSPERPVADLDQIEREGKLSALFDELVADKPLLVKLPLIGASKKEQLANIGERLAKAEMARLSDSLDRQRLPSRLIPLTAIATGRQEGDKLKRWSEVRHREWLGVVDREGAATRRAMDAETAKLAALPVSEGVGRLGHAATLAALGGSGSSDESHYRQLLSDTKNRLYDLGAQALREKNSTLAEKSFSELQAMDAGFKDVVVQLTIARLQVVEREFREPRGDETVEQAFLSYQAMHRDGRLKTLSKQAEPVAVDIRTYYQTLSAAALADDRLVDADRFLRRARTVPGLPVDVVPMAEEPLLVEKVRGYFDHAQRAGKFGLALAYLNVIETYQADYPQLKKLLRETREQAQERAQKRVGISAFGGSDDTVRLGSAVSAKLAQVLFQLLPNDIRLIERDQMQAVLREQEIIAIQNKSSLNIVATDLLVQGTLVEASVENEERKGRQVKRVQTGETTRPNPAWSAWQKMSASERGKTPVPADTLIEPVLEDVAINVGIHRKKGLMSVAYKLIDSASAKVVFTRSETVRRMAEGESSDAVQLGSYVVPMKVAELPSDNEMLGALVDEAVQKLAGELAGQLKDQEKQYEKLALRHASEENHADAADLFSFAALISELKKMDARSLNEATRRQALEAKFSG